VAIWIIGVGRSPLRVVYSFKSPSVENFKITSSSLPSRIRKNLHTLRKMFKGVGLKDIVQQIVQTCEICHRTNPNNRHSQAPGAQRQGTYPGEDRQLDFTHMPVGANTKLLLVLVGTFTGWVEAFPCKTEKAREVVRILVTEIIP
jgi:hypothetical protein